METRPLYIDILTLFPEFFDNPLRTSIVGKSIEKELIVVRRHNIRDWSDGEYRQVDDMPYGGGPGMVLMLEPIVKCVESVLDLRKSEGIDPAMIILCPRGKRLNQEMFSVWSKLDPETESILILSGHYEGFDERIYALYPWTTVSLGDFVLSGGEIPALAIVDGVARLLEGTLGNPESLTDESFNSGSLDHPAYTRPPEFRGMRVPEVLMSGDHAKINSWRSLKRREMTSRFRPDLLEGQGEE
ncbi:MAG: tRNA (guanosine(37)-N1)-methyltransferase TrmD [bacterium]|nr:tRNA (guanosine(37)-N1)-methyltransferase TrmD [bacterium]